MKKLCVLFLLLVPKYAFAYYTENIPNGCDVPTTFYAGFLPNAYTCSLGQYLPAYTLGCRSCPSGFSCPGGTYYFNETQQQGAEYHNQTISNNMNNLCATNLINVFIAEFTPNQHTCAAGYYLPANTDGCTICPANSYCVGGTYTFNETINQGIVACPDNYFSPRGSSVCYPHILHVGNDNVYLKSTKTTTPSLNIGIGNDIFYANMTTTQTLMNKDSSHYFKVQYDNNTYYVCDDSSCSGE